MSDNEKTNDEINNNEMTKTFYSFFKDHNIKIPIIQRDYAQGRDSAKAKSVRENFLDSLKNSLCFHKILDLNFVYGTEMQGGEEEKPTFYPVDGQQRLTTLYLLHYYLFIMSDKIEELKNCGEFLYETRSSAQDFFRWIRKCDDVFVKVIKEADDLSKEIKNMPEYQAVWNTDPTVTSAITMLSDIKKKFGKDSNEISKYSDLLMGEECPILFSVIPPEKGEEAAEKADKTYIRMNARGKELEDFENLRAAIDGIRNKIQDNTNIIENYDKIYLEDIFNSVNSTDLKEVTNSINQKSENIFKNIFNICCLSFENYKCKFQGKKSDYNYYIYKMAKRKPDDLVEYSNDFQTYIDILDCYFSYRKVGYDCICNELESNANLINIEQNYSEDEAVVLYCYFYKEKHKEVPSKDQVDLLKYVLENLDVKNWGNLHQNLRCFCQKVSIAEDVISYFNNPEYDIDKNDLPDNNLDDLGVRLKEQRIKAKLLKSNNLDNKYFEEYEKCINGRKLQFTLYLAGYWKEDSQNSNGDFSKLAGKDGEVGYLKKAQKWLIKDEIVNYLITNKATQEYKDRLEFLKKYAISAYYDKNQGTLSSAEGIRNNCVDQRHIWNSSLCFWTDEDEKKFEDVEARCEILKRTFEIEDVKYQEMYKKLSEEEAYKASWLKYAVINDYEELLKYSLKIEKDELMIGVPGGFESIKWRPYFLYVVKLKHPEWKWGDEKFQKHDVFWDGKYIRKSCDEGFKIEVDTYDFTYNNQNYIYKNNYTYNMNLRYEDVVKIGQSSKDNCLINVKDEKDKNDNSNIRHLYERYTKESGDEIHIKREVFDMTDYVKNVLSRCDIEKNIMENKTKDYYLYLYYMYKKDDNKNPLGDYEKEGGNSHTWKKENKETVQACLKYETLNLDNI